MTDLCISAKTLGELALPGFCPRCFWLKLRGIPGTHTIVLKGQPEMSLTFLESIGIELTPTAFRHTMLRSCAMIIVVPHQRGRWFDARASQHIVCAYALEHGGCVVARSCA
jgi:hypothetical protein